MRILVCIGWLLASLTVLPAQGWRGIVLLHSTRQDVEVLIGPAMQPNGITYDLKNERVNVIYSNADCDTSGAEWNVPVGTVIGIIIYPQTKPMISDVRTDLEGFEKFINPQNPDFVSYNNKDEGISIGTKSNGEVVVIEYFPGAKDAHRRCPGFSRKQLSKDEMQYFRFDEYSNLTFSDERARLDNFAIRLQQEPAMKGYIIVYAGQDTRPGEVQTRAKRAKNYLINRRRIKAPGIITIDGGRREKFQVELYTLPNSISPRMPNLDCNQ